MKDFNYYLKRVFNESIEPDEEALKLQNEVISMLKKVKITKEEENAIKTHEANILSASSIEEIKNEIKEIIGVLKKKEAFSESIEHQLIGGGIGLTLSAALGFLVNEFISKYKVLERTSKGEIELDIVKNILKQTLFKKKAE